MVLVVVKKQGCGQEKGHPQKLVGACDTRFSENLQKRWPGWSVIDFEWVLNTVGYCLSFVTTFPRNPIVAADHELWVAKRSSQLVPSSPSQTQKLGIKNAYTDLIQTLYKLYTNPIYGDGPRHQVQLGQKTSVFYI